MFHVNKMLNSSRKFVNKNVKIFDHDNFFYGRGKLLLSGEYFILDGAKGLVLPTLLGQSLFVKYIPSFAPVLSWKSFDYNGNVWIDEKFEFWHFKCLSENPPYEAGELGKLLGQIRKQNPHFLRERVSVTVETRLEFPLGWGLGSSSTLIHNLSQWARVSPFTLLFNLYDGSGYDIACAQADGPILYEKNQQGPLWGSCDFNPSFRNDLYFVYRGKKKSTKEAINYYRKKSISKKEIVHEISQITDEMVSVNSLSDFETLVNNHENIVSRELGLDKVKDVLFKDYWGEVKSLGGWGGDFILATSSRPMQETREYFFQKGHEVFIPYEDLIFNSRKVIDTKLN